MSPKKDVTIFMQPTAFNQRICSLLSAVLLRSINKGHSWAMFQKETIGARSWPEFGRPTVLVLGNETGARVEPGEEMALISPSVLHDILVNQSGLDLVFSDLKTIR